jgi:hypothetical protein
MIKSRLRQRACEVVQATYCCGPSMSRKLLSVPHAIECGPRDDARAPHDAGRFEDEGFPASPQHGWLPGGVRVKLLVEIPVEALIAERPLRKD